MDIRREEGNANFFEKIPDLVRCASVVIGCIVIIVGMFYVVYTIDHVLGVVKDPAIAEAAVKKLNEIIKGDELLITDTSIKITLGLGRPVSLAIYVFLIFFAGHLSLSLILSGAKVIAWTMNEEGAIKKLLNSAFGEKKKNEVLVENIDFKIPE